MHRALLVIMTAGVSLFSASASAQTGGACDLNSDGKVESADVQLAVNMALGLTPCTASIYGSHVCNVVVVQRVTNAALTGTCLTGTHSVTLAWKASTSIVSGYNVYRGAASTGPFTKLNTSLISALTYVDLAVVAGQTYYYVATAVDANGVESAYSTVSPAAIVPAS
jgi:hypothetical protein